MNRNRNRSRQRQRNKNPPPPPPPPPPQEPEDHPWYHDINFDKMEISPLLFRLGMATTILFAVVILLIVYPDTEGLFFNTEPDEVCEIDDYLLNQEITSYRVNYLNNRDKFDDGYMLEYRTRRSNYRFNAGTVEQSLNDTNYEIPVYMVNEDQFVRLMDAQRPLMNLLNERTENSPFFFRFYSIEFTYPSPLSSSVVHARHWSMLNSVVTWHEDFYEHHKPIIIAQSSGAIPALNFGFRKMDTLTDLLILESPRHDIHEQADIGTQQLYNLTKYHWDLSQRYSSMGVVAFDGGPKDWSSRSSWTSLKGITRVPVWTIDGLPDKGISEAGMRICDSFLQHVADLLMYYGEKRRLGESGKSIVNSFYTEWENRKKAALPSQPIGKTRLVENGKIYDWIKLDLPYGQSSTVRVNSCVSSLTLIRGGRMRRKEKSINKIHNKFNIADVKRMEDLRLVVESDEDCPVDLKVSQGSELLKKFKQGVNTHYYLVAVIITATYLSVLELEKRRTRRLCLMCCYILFCVAFIFHTLDLSGDLFIDERCALIMGFGYGLTTHFLFSWLNDYIMLDWFNFDAIRLNEHSKFLIAAVSAFMWVFPKESNFGRTPTYPYIPFFGMILFILLLSFSTRFFMIGPMAYYIYDVYYRFVILRITLHERHGYQLLYMVMLGSIPISVACYFLTSKADRRVIPRRVAQFASIVTLIVQLFLIHFPLEYHYSASFFIMLLNMYTSNYLPTELENSSPTHATLEKQYIALDKKTKLE